MHSNAIFKKKLQRISNSWNSVKRDYSWLNFMSTGVSNVYLLPVKRDKIKIIKSFESTRAQAWQKTEMLLQKYVAENISDKKQVCRGRWSHISWDCRHFPWNTSPFLPLGTLWFKTVHKMFPDSNIAQKFPVGKLSARQFAVIRYHHRWVETVLEQHGSFNDFSADAYKKLFPPWKGSWKQKKVLKFLKEWWNLSGHWIFWI